MNIKEKKIGCFILWLCLSAAIIIGQDFDYHKEESPAISWNGTQMFDARMLGAGGVSYMASVPFAAVMNPALLPKTGNYGLGLSVEYMNHEASQYWGINQGVYIAPDVLSAQDTGLSGFTFSVPLKKIRLSAGYYLPDLLTLPDFDFDGQYWQYTGSFKGREQNFFAAAAISAGKKLDLGIKIDYIYGKRDLEINEYYKYTNPVESYLLIHRRESHSLNYLAATLGATLKLTPAWTIGASLVYPFKGNAERTINRTFDNLYEPPITYSQTGEDSFYRPAKILFGTVYTLDKRSNGSGSMWTIAAETTYVRWSGYEYIYFSEEVPRDMRDCLIVALGCEFGIYKGTGDYFFRAGYRYDPQPVRVPQFVLHALTFGTGFRYGKITADFGMAYYIAPADVLSQYHAVVSGTLSINL